MELRKSKKKKKKQKQTVMGEIRGLR